jgi:hypothetical protein
VVKKSRWQCRLRTFPDLSRAFAESKNRRLSEQRGTRWCCVVREMPPNSLLASEAGSIREVSAVIFPLTVMAIPPQGRPGRPVSSGIRRGQRKRTPLSVPFGYVVVGFSDRRWIVAARAPRPRRISPRSRYSMITSWIVCRCLRFVVEITTCLNDKARTSSRLWSSSERL